MSTTLPASASSPTALSRNPLEVARSRLIRRLLELDVPKGFHPLTVAEHLRDAAAIFDEWLAAIGSEVRDNAVTSISSGLFSGSFSAAVDGNETYACETQSHAAREYADERRAMRRAS
jgi:hypothetical protein